MSIWILVSDACRATLYATDKRGDDWKLVDSYSHPESRLKNSELTPTEPGHSAKSKGGSRHTTMEPDTSPKQAEMEHFAQQLADVLAAGTTHRSYDRVFLVAPPISSGFSGTVCPGKRKSGSSPSYTKTIRLPTHTRRGDAWKMRYSPRRISDPDCASST